MRAAALIYGHVSRVAIYRNRCSSPSIVLDFVALNFPGEQAIYFKALFVEYAVLDLLD